MHMTLPFLALDPEVKKGSPDKGEHSLLSASMRVPTAKGR